MRNHARRSAALAIVAMAGLAWPAASHGRPSQQVPIGPRALAMGGAYSSISDDASALFWNPAGLPWIGHQEITGTHANLFDTGIQDNLIGFAMALSPRSAAAIDWYHSGFEDPELGFGESRIDLAYGRRINSLLSVGATGKFLQRNTKLDSETVRQGHGFGFDVGLIASPAPRVRVGVIGQDLLDTNVSYSSGDGTAVAYPMNFRAGVSYSPIRAGIVSLDVDDRWHVGAEYRPVPAIALRAGLQDDWDSPDGKTWSAGAGLKAGLLRFDYAIVDHPTLGATSYFGLAMEFNFNPAQIRIEKVEPRDLYASLQRAYSHEPVAVVRVQNLDDRPLPTVLRVMIPGLMRQPTEQEVILRPHATEEVPVTAVLDDIPEGTQNRTVQVRVSATYQSARLPRTEAASGKGVLYAPGAIDWNKGVDQAAAFITPRDPAVDALAHEATRVVALMPAESGSPRNIASAAAIVDALASLDLAYVPDPNNPYSAISKTPHAVDTIAYPRETLARGSGDCDDSSVLLASLLENVGIATKLVDVPGHIFILMDTGIHERNRLGLGLEEARTIVADERVWLPLETTAIAKGFTGAWVDGAEAFAAWSARGRVALVDVQEASGRYEPTESTAPFPRLPALDRNAIQARVGADLGTVAEWREAYLGSRYGDQRRAGAPSPDALNEVARVQFMAGKLDAARATLESVLARESSFLPAVNNVGTVMATGGDLAGAASQYKRALEQDSSDPGIWLNLGLVSYAMGDTSGAEGPLAEGIRRSGGFNEACALLAIEAEPGPEREGVQKLTEAEARALLKAALRKVPRPGRTPVGSPSDSLAQRTKTTKTWTSRVAAGRSTNRDAIGEHLYWKDR